MLKRLNFGRGETIEVKVRGLGFPILLRRSARARRFSLQVSEARRGAVLTMLTSSLIPQAYEDGGREVALLTALGFGIAAVLTLLD